MKLVRDEDGHWIVGKALAPQGEDTDSAEVLDVMMVDFTDVGGTWVNCFGSLSPWNTPLTSEELYFDDDRRLEQSRVTTSRRAQSLRASISAADPTPTTTATSSR